MNKIYKVIWSKAKHTYVVASEIAKGHTKGETTGKGLKKLAAAMLVAAALLSPSFAWAEGTVTVEPAGTGSTTTVEVYTKGGADSTFATQDQLQRDVAATNDLLTKKADQTALDETNANLAKKADQTALDGTNANLAKKADQTALDATIANLAKKADQTALDETNANLAKKANQVDLDGKADKATTLEGYGITNAYTKEGADSTFATQDQLQKDVAATNDLLTKKADKATTLEGYGITDAYTKKDVDNKVNDEKTARESADSALDSRTSALEAKTGSLNRVAVANSTSINESMTLKDKQYSATLQVNGSGAQIGVVNNSAAGLANDGGTAYTEYRARTGVILSKATNDISSTSSNGQVVDTAGDTTGEYSQAATAKSTGTTFTYSNDGGKTSSSTTIKGNSVSTGTVSATAGITDETTKDGTSVIASQTVGQNLNALDERITNVKEYVLSETNKNYVSKDDAAVQDGAIVKADKTIGENVTNLDAALAKETAARIGADKAQDEVIKQVNQNVADGFNTINQNMANGFKTLNEADAKEAAERKAADGKLVDAVNSGVSLSDDNVLQKNTTTIDAQGNVTTSKTDANEMILNKGKDNQITLNEKGIKVGTNSTVVDKDGVYTGGDTYAAAKAAMSSDGQIKGANGKFTVDASGNTTVTSLDAGTGTIQTKGDLYAKDATFSGDITAKDATLSGDLSAKDGTFSGDLSAKDGTFSGDVSAKDVTATGTLQGAEVTDGTATLKQGKLTGVKDIETETLHVNGDANVTGKLTTKDLEVTGEFNANTLKSRLDENNYTEIHGGNVTSKNLKVDKGVTRASESSFDENGREEYVTDNDSRATVKVGANEISQTLDDKGDNPEKAASRVLSQNTNNKYEITDSVVEGNQSNVENRTADTTDSQISFKDDSGKVLNKSYITQNLKKVLMGVEEGDNKTTIEQDANNITNTAKNGTITNDAGKLVNTASDTIANMAGNDITNTSTNGNIANTAANGTISNNAKNLTNTASENITNKAENGNISNIASNGTISNEAKTISNKADEALTNDAKTITNTASESVTTQIGGGSEVQSVMNGGGIANKATGKSITNDAAKITNTGTTSVTNQVGNNKVLVDTIHVQSAFGDTIYTTWDESGITNNATDKTVATNAKNIQNTATGDITNTAEKGTITNKAQNLVNDASGNMTNTIGGNLIDTIMGTSTTTVTGKVTEDYKSDLSTKVGGDETHAVTGNQTTTVSGNRTVNVKGTETENFNALETNVKTDQKTSVGGNQTNIVGGDQQNTVSGSKTETVKGSVTEKYGSQATTVDGDQSTHVGGNQSNVVAGNQTNTISGSKTESVKGAVTETYGSQTTKVNGNQSNTVKGTLTETVTGDVTEDYKANLSTTVGGNQTTTVTGDSSLSAKNINNKATKALTNEAETITNKASESVTSQIGDGSAVKSEMTADGITNTAEGGTIYNKSKDILNEASGDILNFADGEIGNVATKITNITGDNTVTSDTNGTTFENKAHSTAVKEGTITKTTISGNTITTGEAVMDYADVMKDLGVRGNAAVDGNTTLGKEGADTTLTVNSTSTFKKDVTMKSNATVEKNLTVNGQSTFNDKVTITNGGLAVTGGTTTDKLHVTSTSQFDGAATFKDIVTMEKDLNVGGNAKVDGDVTAKSFKVGDKTYINEKGINANNQVIRNVGQGNISEGSTDAVSGGQLYETNTRVSGLETRMGTVETRVDKLDNKIDKVGANAAAMANLHPLEFDEDSKWNIAAAVGSSGSETASAVGVFYRPNENVMVNASAAMGTGENMFGGGVSLRLGHGGNKAKEAQMKAAAAENKELRAKVDDLTARMDALLSVLNPNMSKDFPDVPENHWAYEAVSRLAGNGIVEGYEDGKYHGERQMTRYEMAEIIYNALSKGAKAEKKLVEEFRPELQAMAAQKKA